MAGVGRIDEYKKLQFFKFFKGSGLNGRIFEIFGVGLHSIVIADAIQTATAQTSFKVVRMIDVTDFVSSFSFGNAKQVLADYLKGVDDMVFEYRFDNCSYKEVILK